MGVNALAAAGPTLGNSDPQQDPGDAAQLRTCTAENRELQSGCALRCG